MHKIRLEKDHVDLFMEAMLQSIDIKRRTVIKNAHKIPETERQYADAMAKITETVNCGSLDKNLFTWIHDQIKHTPRLRDQELGLRVMQICDVCAANRYADYVSARHASTQYTHLFEVAQ